MVEKYCISTPTCVLMAWCLIKHEENFTFLPLPDLEIFLSLISYICIYFAFIFLSSFIAPFLLPLIALKCHIMEPEYLCRSKSPVHWNRLYAIWSA
jgi:hypothetical protein